MKWFTVALSFILPGTGQLAHRRWAKGAGFLTGALILSGMLNRRVILSNPFSEGSAAHILLILILLSLATVSAVDAYRSQLTPPAP